MMCSLTIMMFSVARNSLLLSLWLVSCELTVMKPARSALSSNSAVPGFCWKRLPEAEAPIFQSTLPFQPFCGSHGVHGLAGSKYTAT
ncbi:MAG: hypothetical protein GAK39_04284 [Variovorax sp.]|nr:MAG: hypothetical protein GAK39_04284 [Variovorax sp.]